MAKILVIEDDDAVRFSLQAALEAMGHTVACAVDGIDGCIKCADDEYDLVITDLIMPRKDGAETITELRQARPDIKIVAMSGGGKHTDLQDDVGTINADFALGKPFSTEDLFNCLSLVLAETM